MLATIEDMGKKKDRAADRHKPRRMVGVSERMCQALEKMGKTREASLSEMVRYAVMFYLEQHGHWPPPEKPTRK